MNALKKISYNCRKATFLIEKKQIGQITFKEQLELKFHLAGCAMCRLFQRQSLLINEVVKKQFQSPSKEGLKLDETFKVQLQKQIEEELKK